MKKGAMCDMDEGCKEWKELLMEDGVCWFGGGGGGRLDGLSGILG